MFEGLGERLQGVFKELRGEGHLTDYHLETALRQIRLSLLEADVALPVVKQFTERVKERAVGAKVTQQLSPAQEVTRIVRDELMALLGGENADLALQGKPAVIALVGPPGLGQDDLGREARAAYLKTRGRYPLIVAADLARPAAVQQLVTLGKQIGVPGLRAGGAHGSGRGRARGACARRGRRAATRSSSTRPAACTSTTTLMREIRAVAAAVEPQEILFVADAMTGQDAVRSAAGFAEALALTGIILTKTDGDARGGAALSVVSTTGKPIKFVGVGEKPEDFEPFHPDRMASRILGLGDVLTLIEKVEASVDADGGAEARREDRRRRVHARGPARPAGVDEEDGAARGPPRPAAEGGRLQGARAPESVDEKALDPRRPR